MNALKAARTKNKSIGHDSSEDGFRPGEKGRILICGYYGAGNVGDEILLGGLLKSLRSHEKLKHHTPVVTTRTPKRTAELHKVEVVGWEVKSVVSALKSCQAMIVGGGGLFQDNGEPGRTPVDTWLSRVLAGPLMGRATGILGVGVGPLVTERAKKMMADVVRRLDFVAVRDKESAALLESCGLESPPLQTADFAFGIKAPARAEGRRGRLGVNMLPVSTLYHNDTKADARLLIEIAEAVSVLADRHDLTPILFEAHHGVDRELTRALSKKLGDAEVIDLMTLPSMDAMLAALGEVDMMIAMRQHIILGAALCGAPSLSLCYHPKITSLAKLLQLDDYAFKLEGLKASTLIRAGEELFSNLESVSDGMSRACEALAEKSRRNMDLLAPLLGESLPRESVYIRGGAFIEEVKPIIYELLETAVKEGISGRATEIRKILDRLASCLPEDSQVSNVRGYLAYVYGDSEEAKAHFNRALLYDPGNADANANLKSIADEEPARLIGQAENTQKPEEQSPLSQTDTGEPASALRIETGGDIEALVSIYTCAYNTEKYVRQAIESACSQTYENLEILFIDDGSSDGTLGIVRDIGDPRIVIHKLEHKGIAHARTYAKERFKGDFILCLDSDDWIDSKLVEKEVNFLMAEPGVDVVYSDLVLVGEDGSKTGATWNYSDFPDSKVILADLFRKGCSNIPNGSMMERGAIARGGGGYNAAFQSTEDFEYLTRLAGAARGFACLHEALYYYRQTGTGIHTDIQMRNELSAAVLEQMWQNYGPQVLMSKLNLTGLNENQIQAAYLANAAGIVQNLGSQYISQSAHGPYYRLAIKWLYAASEFGN